MRPEYRIYVEGGHVDTVDTLRKANRLRTKYEREGWNVKIIKYVPTVVGLMGVEV